MSWPKRIRVTRKKIPVKGLDLAPVGGSTLTAEQSARLREVFRELSRFPGLDPSLTFEAFEADFSRDAYPEREIALYEILMRRLRKVKNKDLNRAKQVQRLWLREFPPILVIEQNESTDSKQTE
jgi:hypothetical protein